MDATIAGLLGAAIGAAAGVAGAVITQVSQTRLEREKWLRDKRVEAYSSSIRFLIRMSNKRSMITAEGQTVLGKDSTKEWFDDISEARSWLTALLIYCSFRERDALSDAAKSFNEAAERLITSGALSGDLVPAAQSVCKQVSESARRDIGASGIV